MSVFDRFPIHISVGWSMPSDHADDLLLNVHINFDFLDWTDIVDYKMLSDLRKSVNNNFDDFRAISFPVMGPDEIGDTLQMLSETVYDQNNVKQLEKMAKTIALWLEKLFSVMGRLDDESKRLCKQLFFRSLEKLAKFEVLVSLSPPDPSTGTSKESGDRVGNAVGGKRRGSVMDAMGRMFKGTRTIRLNEENLEQYNRNNSGDTEYEPSETGTVRSSAMQSPKEGRMSMARRATMKLFSSRASDNGASEKESSSMPNGVNIHSALEVAEKSNLMRIEVQRGQEAHNGVVMYDIMLKIVGKKYKNPMVYQTTHRFSHFRKLYQQLVEISQSALQGNNDYHGPKRMSDFMLLFSVNFPPLPIKSYLGLSLNDSELSERTRQLDAWFRDVCVNYRNMPSNARQVIRQFLNFDMSQAKDIFFQDQLAWGVIEQQDNKSKPILVVQQSVLNTVPDSMKGELEETLSAVDGQRGGSRAHGAGKSKGNKFSDTISVRSGGEDSSQLHNLLWETASMGGTSKIHKKKAQQSRAILKKIDE